MALSGQAGVACENGWNPHTAPETLDQIRAILPPLRNQDISLSTSDQIGLRWTSIHYPTARNLTPATFTNGRPACFPLNDVITAFRPEFKVLSIPNGYVGHFFGGALVLTSDGSSVVRDVSSRYDGLYQYYDFDLRPVLKEAPYIDGLVIPISDDIRPLNFCHWLVDGLPRLEFLGSIANKSSTYVVTTPLIAKYQRDSLRMCGFDESRVIALDDFTAIRARELLVPSGLRDIPHPIYKGAPWALSYVRSTVGLNSMMEVGEEVRQRERLYVSRNDAPNRRIVNDQELASALAKFGYRCITLSDRSLAEQAARFAYASHIISLHGAGLSNLVFSSPGTQVIEIYPQRYGILSFAVIAASLECPYATYIADNTVAAQVTQFDDAEVDVKKFLEVCGHLI